MARSRPPKGYVDMSGAMDITGLGDETIRVAAQNGQIPGAIQRKRKAPWSFTETGLREWRGIPEPAAATN